MVRPVVVDISVNSVCDALAAVQKQSHSPQTQTDAAGIATVPYPIGGSTLQVTGVHMVLSEKPQKHEGLSPQTPPPKSLPNAIAVLLRAHVRGGLDAKERVFTVAGLTLGLAGGAGGPPPLKGATGGEAGGAGVPRPNAAFANLDLRVQMERIRFSVEVKPLGAKRMAQKRLRTSAAEEEKADGSPVDWVLRVTVMGTVSSLLL